MSRPARAFITRAVLLISVLTGLAAGQTKLVPGPIPTQITTAKKVFIANAGGDEPGIDEPIFSGGVDRSYNQFYAAMKSAGRYDIVGSLAEPDLLFEIRFTVNTTPTRVFKGIASEPALILNSAWKFAILGPALFCGHLPSTCNGPFCRATGTRISIKPLPALWRTCWPWQLARSL